MRIFLIKTLVLSAMTTSALASEMKEATESPTKVTFTGRAQIELAQYEDNIASNFKLDDTNLGRAGFKITHDLGDGMTALAGAEWKLDFSDNNTGTSSSETPFSQRETYIGLKSDWGTLKAGNQPSPYKMTGGVKYDPFVATLLEARGNGGMTGGAYGHNSFISKTISYDSPKLFGGLSASVLYRPDTVDAGKRGSDDDSSLSVIYAQKTWEAFVATVSESSTNTDRVKIGGKVLFGDHTVNAQYENTDASNGSKTFFMGYNFKLGKTNLVAQAGRTDPDTGSATDYLSVGAIYKFSSKYRLFGGYRNTDSGTNDIKVFSVGMRLDFNS